MKDKTIFLKTKVILNTLLIQINDALETKEKMSFSICKDTFKSKCRLKPETRVFLTNFTDLSVAFYLFLNVNRKCQICIFLCSLSNVENLFFKNDVKQLKGWQLDVFQGNNFNILAPKVLV